VNDTGPEYVSAYQEVFDRLRAVAVVGEEAQRLIAAAAQSL
jgi:hypothetical protein